MAIDYTRRRQWHPTPVLLPGKSRGWRILVGCSPWGREESGTTERLHFHFSLSCIGEGNGNPLQCSCLENPRDGGAWWAAVYGVSQSWTRLKRLSSSRSSKSQEDRERLIVLQWYKTYLGKGLLFLVLIWFGFPKLNTQSAETKSFLHSMVNYLPAVWVGIPGLGRYPGEGNGNPLQYSCLENSMDRGAWWATVHGVAKSRTQLSNFTTITIHVLWNA